MKKILSMFLVLTMMLSMAACDCNSKTDVTYPANDQIEHSLHEQNKEIENTNATESEVNQVMDIRPGNGDRETVVGGSNVFIHDDANLLTNDDEKALIHMVAKYANEMYFNVLFLTYNDANGLSTKDFSDNYMDNMFPVDIEDNIAFVIDMDNREVYINTMGKAIAWLDNGDIEAALDAGWDHVTNSEWGYALIDIADYSLAIIANGGRG